LQDGVAVAIDAGTGFLNMLHALAQLAFDATAFLIAHLVKTRESFFDLT